MPVVLLLSTISVNAQILNPNDPIVPFLPEEQVQAPTASDVEALRQAALQKNKTTTGPALYQNIQGMDKDDLDTGFRILVPQGWVLDSWTFFDKLVTDETNGDLEARAQMLHGAKAGRLGSEGGFEKAVMCIQNQSEPEIGGSVSCSIEKTTGIIMISKYEDLETVPLFKPIIDAGRNITADDLIAYHLKLAEQSGSTFGFSYQIRNMTNVAVNLTDAATNHTIGTLPAKFLEYTYHTSRYDEPQRIPAGITAMLFVVYNDPQTHEVTGYDVQFRTDKFNAANLPVAGMIMQPEHNYLAPELKKIFGSFEVVRTSTVATSPAAQSQVGLTESTQTGERPQVQQGPQVEETGQEESDCDPSYPDNCIPSPPPDLNCDDISDRNFRVIGSDPHGFDGDNDGIGCEKGSSSKSSSGSDSSDSDSSGSDDSSGGLESSGGGSGTDDSGGGSSDNNNNNNHNDEDRSKNFDDNDAGTDGSGSDDNNSGGSSDDSNSGSGSDDNNSGGGQECVVHGKASTSASDDCD